MAVYYTPPAIVSYQIPNFSTQEKAILANLNTKMRNLCIALVNECKRQGITIQIVSGLRPIWEQQKLYNQGRDVYGNIIDPLKVVTYAKPGGSYHNYGLAIDFCINMPGRDKYDPDLITSVGEIGEKLIGLRWGGRFTQINDTCHFEWSNGLSIAQLRAGLRP